MNKLLETIHINDFAETCFTSLTKEDILAEKPASQDLNTWILRLYMLIWMNPNYPENHNVIGRGTLSLVKEEDEFKLLPTSMINSQIRDMIIWDVIYPVYKKVEKMEQKETLRSIPFDKVSQRLIHLLSPSHVELKELVDTY